MSEFSINSRINDYAGFKVRPEEVKTEGMDERQTDISASEDTGREVEDAKASIPLSNTEFASKALSEANVAISERNLEMVMELALHGMSVDKETLQMLGRDLLRSPELSVRQAVEMKQQGIEPTPMRVAFYNAITDEGWSANGALNDLIDVLLETALPKEVEDSIRQTLLGDDQGVQRPVQPEQILHQMPGDQAPEVNQPATDGNIAAKVRSFDGSTLVENADVSDAVYEKPGEFTMAFKENPSEDSGEKHTETIGAKMNEGAQVEVDAQVKGGAQVEVGAQVKGGAQVKAGAQVENPVQVNYNAQTDDSGRTDYPAQMNGHSDPLTDTAKNSRAEATESASQRYEDSKADTVRHDVEKAFHMTESLTEKAGAVSDSLPELLSRHFRLEPKELLKKGRISRYYREIETTMRKLSEAAKELGEKGQRLSGRAESVRESFETMRSLSDAYAFIQFPIKMSEETVNGELFVYRKKHGKKDSSEGVLVLLHLDMTNLGSTNVMIRMSHMNASLTFGLADEKSASLLKSHLPELNAVLQRHGYTASCKVEQSTDEKDFKTPDLPPATPGSEFRTYSFDKKA